MNFADGEPDPDARIITALCGGIRVTSVYVPNGRSLDDDHYQYKLRWLAQLRAHVAGSSSPDDPVIVAGDFNIAPADIDVYDPAKFVGATHTSPAGAGPARPNSCDWGMVDLFRQHHSDGQVVQLVGLPGGRLPPGSRPADRPRARHTQSVAERCTWSVIDRNARKGQMPSDHAPVIVELD